MSAQHTPGRVKVQHPHAGPRGWEVAFEPGLEQLCQNITEDNARRLVACWNACDGLYTESLERGGSLADQIVDAINHRDELLAALKAAHLELHYCSQQLVASGWTEGSTVRAALDGARATIAKATGGAA